MIPQTKYKVFMNDGTVTVLSVPATTGTIEQSKWYAKNIDTILSYSTVTNDAEISDRTFRNAWEANQSRDGIKVNMTKARDIHMDKIRIMRDKKLDQLDVDYMRAQEQGNTTLINEIIAEKDRLRDLPATFDLSVAGSATELKALWPSNLDKHYIYS